MRKLERGRAALGQEHRDPGDEVVDVRDLREDVVAEHETGPLPSATSRRANSSAEELDECRDAAGDRRLGHVPRGVDAEHGHPVREEVLEEVAVVGRQLDDQVVGVSERRATIISTYRRACSTHESEYAEKYAYSVKIASGGTNSGICTSQHCVQTFAWSG